MAVVDYSYGSKKKKPAGLLVAPKPLLKQSITKLLKKGRKKKSFLLTRKKGGNRERPPCPLDGRSSLNGNRLGRPLHKYGRPYHNVGRPPLHRLGRPPLHSQGRPHHHTDLDEGFIDGDEDMGRLYF